MHFAAIQIIEKLKEHRYRVKKHFTSLIKRTMETIDKDIAILLWEPLNNKFEELK